MLDFEKRKRDHIAISLSDQSQAETSAGFDKVELIHEALPDFNFQDIQLRTTTLGLDVASPFFVSSMTLGHDGAPSLNQTLASVCEQRGWLMGVGSQRRQLTDPSAAQECVQLRKSFPDLKVLGNIGISQLISITEQQVLDLVGSLQAQGLIVHLNPLQECLQPEGTPQFKGGLEAIEHWSSFLKVPLIIKETGCGISLKTLKRLAKTRVAAVDVSGRGGTHWGRVETVRSESQSLGYESGLSFKEWGISTVEATKDAVSLTPPYEVWSSGGVRTGLDAAKLLAMGAQMVGIARPALQAALNGEDALGRCFDVFERELKIAMFCTGVDGVSSLRTEGVWKWI